MLSQQYFKNETLRTFLRGAAYPGMIVTGCAAIGLLMDIFNFRLFGGSLPAFKAGIALGLFASLFGGPEFMISLLFTQDATLRKKLMRICGYFTVWALCIFIIINPTLF